MYAKRLNVLKPKSIDDEKPIKIIFSLETFNQEVFATNKRSDEILEYLFLYARYVLDDTRKKYYDKLRFYEKLVNEIDPV